MCQYISMVVKPRHCAKHCTTIIQNKIKRLVALSMRLKKIARSTNATNRIPKAPKTEANKSPEA